MNKIKTATIGPMPKSLFDKMPEIKVELEDGTAVTLFSFYPDEISFRESEFIGLTVEEGKSLKFRKDKAYLQS